MATNTAVLAVVDIYKAIMSKGDDKAAGSKQSQLPSIDVTPYERRKCPVNTSIISYDELL